jgi:hypothetical protein
MATGGFQLLLRCQPEPVFIQALQAPAVSHCKKSGKPSPVTSTIRTPLSAGWRRNDAYKPKTIINGKGVRILDVNGNGLVDYLQCDAAGRCKAWINTGSGWQRNDSPMITRTAKNQAGHRRLHQQYAHHCQYY